MRLRRFKPNPAHLRVATLAILITMCTLLILSAVFPFPEGEWGFLSIGPSQKVLANPDWLSGWDYRIEASINASYIDSDLTHFPVLLNLGTSVGENDADVSCIFDEIGEHCLKLAVTRSDGTTQLYVEVVGWNNVTEEADLWVSNSTWVVDDTADTSLYVYYDNDHADNTDYVAYSGNRTEVWDSNFEAVWHNSAMKLVEPCTDSSYSKIVGLKIAEMGNGDLLAMWTASDSTDFATKNIEQSISTDRGLSWTNTTEEWTNDGCGYANGPMWTAGNTTYMIYYCWCSSPDDCEMYVSKTEDYGDTWSAGSHIDTDFDYNIPQSAIAKVQTNEGRMVVGYQYWKVSESKLASSSMYCDGGCEYGSNWTVSSDEMYAAVGGGTYEPTIVELSDGDLYCMLRTNNPPSGTLYEATSTNDGANWTTPSSSGLVSKDTPVLYRTSWSPNEVMLFMTNDGSNRYPYGSRFSLDDCDTWGNFTTIFNPGETCLIKYPCHLGGNRYIIPVAQYPDATYQQCWAYIVNYPVFHHGLPDSTSNDNDGYAVEREQSIIYCGDDLFESDSLGTIDAWIDADSQPSTDDYPILSSADDSVSNRFFRFAVHDDAVVDYELLVQHSSSGGNNGAYGDTVVGTSPRHIAVTSSGTAWSLYLDGAAESVSPYIDGNNGNWFADLSAGTNHVYIGKHKTSTKDNHFDGAINEVRVSSSVRAAAWLKATYYTELDGLLDWSTEESPTPEITNTPNTNDFGILEVSGTGNTAINYFTIENTGNCAVDVVIYGTDATGGDDTWDLDDTATPGENTYGLKAGLDDEDDTFDVIVKEVGSTPYTTLVSDLAEDASQDWGLKIWMPTTLSGYDCNEMSATITLVASEAS